MANNEKENWRVHPDISGIEVSTLGRVRTLDRLVSNGKGTYLVKGHILKPFGNGNGYMRVGIRIDGKWTNKYVHRLVAQTFIPNPDNLPQVNHLDCDRKNNNVKNLEFCTHEENIAYREKYGEAQNKPVYAINLATLKVFQFPSQKEAGRELGIFRQNISAVIKGRIKQAHGFWFTNDDENAADAINRKLQDIKKIYS